MSELATIQKWLTSIIIEQGRLDERIRVADQLYRLNSKNLITPSRGMTPDDKIAVYARGYLARLIECMEAEYPVLQRLMGEDLFDFFCRAYLVNMPSDSPDLYDLGRDFADFLEASQPGTGTGDADDAKFDLPVDIARAERAFSEVSRGRGTEEKNVGDALAGNQMLLLFQVSLHVSPCLQLLQMRYAVIDFIKAGQHGREAPIPEKRDNYIAVSRRNYAVSIHELEPWQWHFLNAMARDAGHIAAVETAATACLLSKDSLLAQLMVWMPIAVNNGYLYAY